MINWFSTLLLILKILQIIKNNTVENNINPTNPISSVIPARTKSVWTSDKKIQL